MEKTANVVIGITISAKDEKEAAEILSKLLFMKIQGVTFKRAELTHEKFED